jgi:hypothetical protein
MRAAIPAMWGAAKQLPVALMVDPPSQGTSMSMPGAPNSTGGPGWADRRSGSAPGLQTGQPAPQRREIEAFEGVVTEPSQVLGQIGDVADIGPDRVF